LQNCNGTHGTHGTHGMPPITLLIYLTNINSPKYSSKPIVRVIKKQYLCRWFREQVLWHTNKFVC